MKNYTTNIFTLCRYNDEKGDFKILKTFVGTATLSTTGVEEKIASALYLGYKDYPQDEIMVREFFADGYSNYRVEYGKFRTDVINTAPVKDLNHFRIGRLFEEYKNGTSNPVSVEDNCYTFLDEPRSEGIEEFIISKPTPYFDYRTFPSFIKYVMDNPGKYPEKVVDICKDVYGYTSTHLYFGEDIAEHPRYLQPIGFEALPTGSRSWDLVGEVDGRLVKSSVTYAPSEYSISREELAGKLIENYVLNILEDYFYKYALNRKSYKINQVVDAVSRYISDIRRKDYHKTNEYKNPDVFLLDKHKIPSYNIRGRITEGIVDEVINFFCNNMDIFSEMEEKNSSMESDFYKWFEGRISRGEALFV